MSQSQQNPPESRPCCGNQSEPQATTSATGGANQAASALCCCEYYCSGGEWWCIDAHPPSGYYCLGNLDPGCQSGYTYFPPVPIGSLETAAASRTPAPRDCGEYCTYKNVGGRFHLVEGHCGCGNYCPTDLLAYLKAHDIQLYAFLVANPDSLQTLSIHPGSILGCQIYCHGGHHGDGERKEAEAPPSPH